VESVFWVFGFLIGIVGLKLWFRYRLEALRIKGGSEAETGQLERRVEALEKQCAKLQEQVLDAHALLADEQRQLDRKLTAMLPDAPDAAPGNEAARKQTQPERARI